jgi:predicted nucleic acid-binding protein
LGPRYLLDTSVLVDLVRGDARPVRLLGSLPADAELWSVTGVRTELMAGARPEGGPSVVALFDELRWLRVDEQVAELAGRMAAHLDPAHQGIALADYLVAAGTRLLGAGLLTLNVRHYPMIDGLRTAYS